MAKRGGDTTENIRLAPTNPDPLASLAVWPVKVSLGGKVFSIPALDAAAWLMILLAEEIDLEAIFPGMAGPEAVAEVNRMLLWNEATEEELAEAIQDALEAVSGRRWWIAMRLCRIMRNFWERAGGELAASGVTPFGVSLSWWLDAAYATCIRLIAANDPKKLGEFTQSLVMPPPSEGRKVDEVANSQAFLVALRQSGRI